MSDLAPIFQPDLWGLTDQQSRLCAVARELASDKFAPRAAHYDRTASFPTENYADLASSGLLGICIPASEGGLGADLKTYMLAASEIGRFCGATALTFNMHVSSCLWTGDLLDQLEFDQDIYDQHRQMRKIHYQRILKEGKIYSQPFSEGSAAAAGFKAFGTTALKTDSGWVINGKKIFASLSGHADYYGALCTELDSPDGRHSRRNTMYIAIPADAPGVRVEGAWDPLGMRGTVSRTLIFEDVVVPKNAQLMPAGIYPQAASRWPHMFMTLTPAYMGIAQACYDFTVAYLRGEIDGMPPVKRRMYPTKQLAVAQMRLLLDQTKALWFQAITEARPDPSNESLMRAWSAQHTVMENANTLAQLAIRTCGGQSMLRSLPLERLYRDSRCGSLMLPWTAELCLDMLGKAALYKPGETDDD
jgi:alkylation response protein AidB-like acyl-CoA dehydrogenase